MIYRVENIFFFIINEAERIHSTPERELTAIVYGLQKCKSLIWSTPVTIFTNNQGLSYLQTMESPNMRMTKLMLKLLDFNYTLKWIPRSKNEFADYLSKYPADLYEIPTDNKHIVKSATLKYGKTPDASKLDLTSLDIAAEQRKDSSLLEIISALQNPENYTKSQKRKSNNFYLKN